MVFRSQPRIRIISLRARVSDSETLSGGVLRLIVASEHFGARSGLRHLHNREFARDLFSPSGLLKLTCANTELAVWVDKVFGPP
jgi:hypothetical protein